MKMISALFIALFLLACSSSEEGNKSTNNITLYDVPLELRGQWQYLNSDTKVWLGEKSELQFTQVDTNLLKLADTNSSLYLVRSGASNVSVTGQLNQLITQTASKLSKTNPDQTRQAPAIGNFNIAIRNIHDPEIQHNVPVNSNDGTFNVSLPASDYTIEAVGTLNGSQQPVTAATEIYVAQTQEDIGEITVVDQGLYNFKVELVKPKYRYFGTLPGQEDIIYNEEILVKNIGSTSYNGVGFTIVSPGSDNEITLISNTNSVGSIDPGQSKTITASLKFKRPANDKLVQLSMIITDAAHHEWHDHVSFNLSSRPPVHITTDSYNPSGRLLLPDGNIAKFGDKIPHQTGSYVKIGLVNTTSSEYGYCIDVESNSCSYGLINTEITAHPTITSNNEPQNNNVGSPTTPPPSIDMFKSHVGYLHRQDIDFLQINFNDNNKPFDAYQLGSITIANPLIKDVFVSGNYLYATGSSGYFGVFDITDPANIQTLGTIILPDNGLGVALVTFGNYAYVITNPTGTDDHLYTIDISNSSMPTVISTSTISLTTTFYDIAIANNHIYIAAANGMHIFDLSIPSAPNSVGYYLNNYSNSYGRNIIINSNYAYMTGTSLSIIDISNNANPIERSNILIDSTYSGRNWNNLIFYEGFLVSIRKSSSAELIFFDITDPTNPIESHVISNSLYYSSPGLAIHGATFYFLQNYSGTSFMHAYQINNALNNFTPFGDFSLPTSASPMKIRSFNGIDFIVSSSNSPVQSYIQLINPNQ